MTDREKAERTHEIAKDTHARVLDFFNRAYTADDLRRLPENEFQPEEEHLFRGPGLLKIPDREKPRRPPALLDRDTAVELIDQRDARHPIAGFEHVDQIQAIIGLERFLKIRDIVVAHFGRAVYGEWRQGDRVEMEGVGLRIAHAALLCSGKVMFIEAACIIGQYRSETPLWNPSNGQVTFPNPPQDGGQYENLYCSGHSFLSDGKLLVVGGGGENGNVTTPDMVWIFDPDTETWDVTRNKSNPNNATNRTKMSYPRWYPTVVTLGDDSGRVFIASGWPSATNSKMEIYSEQTGTFTDVTAADPPGDRDFGQLYPGLHLLPGGEVFFSPTGWSGGATIEESGFFDFSSAFSGRWQGTGTTDRGKGMSVQILSPTYPFVRVMVVGGRNAGKTTSYQIINLSTLAPAWQPDTALPKLPSEAQITARTNVNVVLLPDNTVFVSGGASANSPCWLFDTAAGGSWSSMAALPTQRAYHSFALLLPSGEVMTSGGGHGGTATGSDNLLEIFSPPYLFNPDGSLATRPEIQAVTEYPDVIHHGQEFEIDTPQAADIAEVVLVRPMAVTHQTDTEQRVVHLSFAKLTDTTLRATAPDGWHPHGMAPAGCYMLFIIDGRGVPSIAKFIRLH